MDALVIDCMKKRAEFAKLAAGAISAQCFVLTVFFCSYGIVNAALVFSDNRALAEHIAIAISVVISILLGVYNFFVAFRYKELVWPRDIIAASESDSDKGNSNKGNSNKGNSNSYTSDKRNFHKRNLNLLGQVEEAYAIARPLLIYKITGGLFLIFLSGPLYILLEIVRDRDYIAGIYGRMLVFFILAIALYIIIPCFLRIRDYRILLGQICVTRRSRQNTYSLMIIGSVTLPVSICLYYIVRFYTSNGDIAFMIFPITALFSLAIYYLKGYALESILES